MCLGQNLSKIHCIKRANNVFFSETYLEEKQIYENIIKNEIMAII